MSEISINVIGTPAPQGSKRHVGRGVMIESSKRVRPWREAVAAQAAQAPGNFGDRPVFVSYLFVLPSTQKSRSHRAKRGFDLAHSTKPDLDKLIRSTNDALVQGGLIADDSRIVGMMAEKRYAVVGASTGAKIVVRDMAGDLAGL